MKVRLDESKLLEMTVLGLAHIGDAVYELMVRTWVCTEGTATARKMHSRAVEYVSAKSQAEVSGRILEELTEEELAVYKRGRNAHVNTVPRGCTYEEYHQATGLEALFGYLYLRGEVQRLNELFEKAVIGRKEA